MGKKIKIRKANKEDLTFMEKFLKDNELCY
jgi:hypothetical protein